MNEKIIAACGNDCAACPRYIKHPYEKTDEELRHTAELWMKIGYRDHIVTSQLTHHLKVMGLRLPCSSLANSYILSV